MKKTFLLKLITTGKLKVGDGTIQLEDTYLNLYPSVFTSSLMEYFGKRDELHKLYLISWFWGYDLAKYVSRDLGLESQDEIYKVGMDLLENMGFGLYKTGDYYPGEYTRFKINTNPFLDNVKGDLFDGPADYFVSGLMGGGGCMVHDAVTQDVEVHCKSENDAACEFITGTKEELEERGLWKTAQNRYHLDTVLPFQKEIFEDYSRENAADFNRKLSDILEQI